jgi:hypothetical protein
MIKAAVQTQVAEQARVGFLASFDEPGIAFTVLANQASTRAPIRMALPEF